MFRPCLLHSATGCPPISSDLMESALALWGNDHEEPRPTGSSAILKKSWDLPKVRATYESLPNSAPDASSRARFLSAACKESGAWLDAPPVTSLGLRMDNEVIRIALGLRLGLPFCDPHPCTQPGGRQTRYSWPELSLQQGTPFLTCCNQ